MSVLQFDHRVARFPSAKSQLESVGLSSRLVTVEGTFRTAQQPTGTLSGQCVYVCLCECVLDLGPPALYELCDLSDMEAAQVEVM